MKKFMVWMAAGLMLFSLAACGSQGQEPSEAPAVSDQVSAQVSDGATDQVVSSEPSSQPGGSEQDPGTTETAPAVTDGGEAALNAALAAPFASGYLVKLEDGECLIAATEDGQKAVVLQKNGQENKIFFGDVQQSEEGVLTVKDDATGAVFSASLGQDEAGQIMVILHGEDPVIASAVDADAIMSMLEEAAA